MTSVSAVIITHNESANIARCLEALVDVVDEIVVMDSFSTDDTAKICERYPVRFFQQEWQGYSATKNKANQLATHDYILSVDADEVLDEKLQQSVLKERTARLSGAYIVNRKTNYCGHWVRFGGWYPDRKVRLFSKSGARWEGDFVHETLVLKDDIRVVQLDGHLLHYSYHTLDDHRGRIQKYARLHAQKMATDGKSTSSIKAIFSAGWKFLQVYFFKLGLLDGGAGWNIARFSARAVFLKHRLLMDIHSKPPHENTH